MNSCEYCPPPHFIIHSYCHFERQRMERNFAKFLENKENLSPIIAQSLQKWVRDLNEFCKLCKTEENFSEYGRQLLRFNQISEIAFQIWEYE